MYHKVSDEAAAQDHRPRKISPVSGRPVIDTHVNEQARDYYYQATKSVRDMTAEERHAAYKRHAGQNLEATNFGQIMGRLFGDSQFADMEDMTTGDVAQQLGISQNRVRLMCQRGVIQATQDAPGEWWHIQADEIRRIEGIANAVPQIMRQYMPDAVSKFLVAMERLENQIR